MVGSCEHARVLGCYRDRPKSFSLSSTYSYCGTKPLASVRTAQVPGLRFAAMFTKAMTRATPPIASLQVVLLG